MVQGVRGEAVTAPRYVRRVEARLVDRVCELPPEAIGASLTDPAAVGAVACRLIGDEPQEAFGAILLDAQHKLIGWREVSRGTLTSSLVHPREVFREAITLNAAALIVVHCHPSGDPTPSREDRAVTERLVAAGKLLGIPVLDHVVVAGDRWVSARELGWIS